VDTFVFRQGAGRLCLDFIRTLRHRGRPDAFEELADGAALAAWAAQCGPVPAGAATATATGPALAHRLREAIFTLVTQRPAGCTPADRDRINEAAGWPPPVPSLGPAGALHYTAADPVAAVLSLVARDALDLATSPVAGRVRECANPECSALFLDNSRPGNRRWCAMGSCGNRAKKTAYRERHPAGARIS
jgi:predicted RNA-binding Zn ribbon-like protein